MDIYILTIFPEMTDTVFRFGIVRRAVESGIVRGFSVDLRNYTEDRHRSVDDAPFGGGPGMVMLAEPIRKAAADIEEKCGEKPYLVHLSPQGERITHELVIELAALPRLALLCGRYEGIDQRAIDLLVDREVSFGDFVMSGGEIPAMALVDAVVRYIPGALGNEDSRKDESFVGGLLDYPHFTRPEVWQGMRAPQELLSGDSEEVARYRRMQAMSATKRKRPDLWEKFSRRDGSRD